MYKNISSIQTKTNVLVIDNGSKDQTISIIKKEFPTIKLIENKENLGFAAANNLGFEIARKENYDWVFLLNHDAWVDEDCLSEIQKIVMDFNHKDYGILSPVHYSGDGKNFDFGFKRFFDVNELSENNKNLHEVDWVNGAFMMISKECLTKLKGFDPIFFFYGEDVDLCCRAKKLGYKIGVVSQAKAYHDRATRKESPERRKNKIISNHLVQFKQIEGDFRNSYYKTILSSFIGGIRNFTEIKYYYQTFKFLVKNKAQLKKSFKEY